MVIDDDYLKSRSITFKNEKKMVIHTNSGVFDCNVIRIGLKKEECIMNVVSFALTYVDDFAILPSSTIGDSSSSIKIKEYFAFCVAIQSYLLMRNLLNYLSIDEDDQFL
jgi:hypothetical protein